MVFLTQLQLYEVVLKVDISDAHIFGLLRVHLGIALSKGVSTSCELFEFHDVLCKCTSLVREDVLDSSKLFIQI